MRQVKVNKEELAEALWTNLKKHRADYEEACADYRKAAILALDERALRIQAAAGKLRGRLADGETVPLHFQENLGFDLAPPESHEKDYLQILRMMEMEVEPTVLLSTAEFQMFVMDDWDWKSEFDIAKSLYTIRASRAR